MTFTSFIQNVNSLLLCCCGITMAQKQLGKGRAYVVYRSQSIKHHREPKQELQADTELLSGELPVQALLSRAPPAVSWTCPVTSSTKTIPLGFAYRLI